MNLFKFEYLTDVWSYPAVLPKTQHTAHGVQKDVELVLSVSAEIDTLNGDVLDEQQVGRDFRNVATRVAQSQESTAKCRAARHRQDKRITGNNVKSY